ncbi:hypothetical protein BS17DRAFT_777754 [Gyrodon lividus]|nr:hypothetical protein BS17DRAFT_777754 [Gyrodon lividus]
MFRFASLHLVFACTATAVVASPTSTPAPSICDGFQWGVTIQELNDAPMKIYNQYVQSASCAGPAWVMSSTESTPPMTISPWGVTYECKVPEIQYYCDVVPVSTCCGNLTAPA